MFIRLFNKRGQNTAEYAILIGLVIAAAVAMQVYVKRGLQAKVKYETDELAGGKQDQYEPYYLDTGFTSARDTIQTESVVTGGGVTRTLSSDLSNRIGNQIYKAPE